MSSAREEYRQLSRSSSDTHLDLEKGEARPHKKEEEEEVVQEKVCAH
jgi:hypothetical protein